MAVKSYKSNQEFLRYSHFKSATALDQFFGRWLKWYSVFSTTSLCLQYSFYPSGHTLYDVLTHFCPYTIPFLLYSIPKFQDSCWGNIIVSHPPLEMSPEMFNWIEVWRLCWPWENWKPWPLSQVEAILDLCLGSLSCWKMMDDGFLP